MQNQEMGKKILLLTNLGIGILIYFEKINLYFRIEQEIILKRVFFSSFEEIRKRI
jgi:hypothetical protein